MIRRSVAALMTCGLLAFPASGSARAEVTVSGTADALTVTAQQAERAVVIAAIVERLGLSVEGRSREAGTVDGRFTGSLAEVLRTVLQSEGYMVAYRDGRPSRISFASHGGGSAAMQARDTLALPPSDGPGESPEPSPEPMQAPDEGPVSAPAPSPGPDDAPVAAMPEAPLHPTGWTPDAPVPEETPSPHAVGD